MTAETGPRPVEQNVFRRGLSRVAAVITGGPLAGLGGHVVEFLPASRVVVSVRLWQRRVLVEIDQDWVILLPRTSGVGRVMVRIGSVAGQPFV